MSIATEEIHELQEAAMLFVAKVEALVEESKSDEQLREILKVIHYQDKALSDLKHKIHAKNPAPLQRHLPLRRLNE